MIERGGKYSEMRFLIFMTCASLLAPELAFAATQPLNCKKASNEVEHTICASAELKAMDREIAALYDRGRAEFSADDRRKLAQGQLTFLKQRAGCAWAAHHSAHPGTAVDECIHDKMEIWVHLLRSAVDHGRYNH